MRQNKKYPTTGKNPHCDTPFLEAVLLKTKTKLQKTLSEF